jgi:hypothetical protein
MLAALVLASWVLLLTSFVVLLYTAILLRYAAACMQALPIVRMQRATLLADCCVCAWINYTMLLKGKVCISYQAQLAMLFAVCSSAC